MTDVVNGEVKLGGRARTFTLRLPRGAAPDALVVLLHGNHPEAGGRQIRQWTAFDWQADAWGIAVAYPDGHEGSWADGRGVTRAEEAGVDDVAFLRAVIDWSADRYGTFPDRTIVAGMSNGASMAHRMALEASDQVAVLAAVAGQIAAPAAHPAPFPLRFRWNQPVIAAKQTGRSKAGNQRGVSRTYRNYCRPPTGTASATCRPGTGTKVSSIYRDRTRRLAAEPLSPCVNCRSPEGDCKILKCL